MSPLANIRPKAEIPSMALGSLRWPSRPEFPEGNPCWTFMVEGNAHQFAVQVGHVMNGRAHPFEVWVAGSEQPRVLGAVAKTLSADMRSQDRGWLFHKLDALQKVNGGEISEILIGNQRMKASSYSSILSQVISYRLAQLQVCRSDKGETPLMDALLSIPNEGGGRLSWTYEVINPNTHDEFSIVMPEVDVGEGRARPYEVKFHGEIPCELKGLAALLSLDMKILDLAWIAMKLRKLLNYTEPMGAFHAKVPGTSKTKLYASTVAYVAELILYRYICLGELDSTGYPVQTQGIMVEVAGHPTEILQ